MTYKEKRLDLHRKLVDILGNNRVYNSPPTKLEYPCILYTHSGLDVKTSDNKPYKKAYKWTITHITKDPLDDISEKMFNISYCTFDRKYTADKLIHTVFIIKN